MFFNNFPGTPGYGQWQGPPHGGYAGGGPIQQGQQVWGSMPVQQLGGAQQGYGQGYWGAGGGGGMYGGGYGMRRPNYAQQGGGDAYSTTPAPMQQQPQQPADQPNYTGLPGATNANYGQQYGQFLGQMYQPPQQINQSSQPIANRPMTYRPIQQQLPSFGSYSRY